MAVDGYLPGAHGGELFFHSKHASLPPTERIIQGGKRTVPHFEGWIREREDTHVIVVFDILEVRESLYEMDQSQAIDARGVFRVEAFPKKRTRFLRVGNGHSVFPEVQRADFGIRGKGAVGDEAEAFLYGADGFPHLGAASSVAVRVVAVLVHVVMPGDVFHHRPFWLLLTDGFWHRIFAHDVCLLLYT